MENLINSAKQAIETVGEQLTQAGANVSGLLSSEVLEPLREYSLDTLRDTWKALEASTELIERTGYRLSDVHVNMTLPPSISLNFIQTKNIEDETEEALLKETKNDTLLHGILTALFKANAVQKALQSAVFSFSEITITLGVPPSFNMKYQRV